MEVKKDSSFWPEQLDIWGLPLTEMEKAVNEVVLGGLSGVQFGAFER